MGLNTDQNQENQNQENQYVTEQTPLVNGQPSNENGASAPPPYTINANINPLVAAEKAVALRLYTALHNFEKEQRTKSKYTYDRCGKFTAGIFIDLCVPAGSIAGIATGTAAGASVGIPFITLYSIFCFLGNVGTFARAQKESSQSWQCFSFTRLFLGHLTNDDPYKSYAVSQPEYAQLLTQDPEIANLLTSWAQEIDQANQTIQLPPLTAESKEGVTIETVRKMQALIERAYQLKYNEPIHGNVMNSYVMRMR